MSKQKKESEQETNQDPLADLIQPKAQAAKKPSKANDLAAMEQDLLQAPADSSPFDPETLAALSDLAEMEASLLLNPLAAPKPTPATAPPPAAAPEANKPSWLDDDPYGETVSTLPEDEGLLNLLDQAMDALLAGQADDIFMAADLDQTAVSPTPPTNEPIADEPIFANENNDSSAPLPDDTVATSSSEEEDPLTTLLDILSSDSLSSDSLSADALSDDALPSSQATDSTPFIYTEAPAVDLSADDTDALLALQLPAIDLSADDTDALNALQEPAPLLSDDEADALNALQPSDPDDYLHSIVSSIDQEVNAVYGDGTMVDLSSEQQAAPAYNLRQYVVFMLAGELYAASAHHVREVAQLTAVTRIPNVPSWLLGVTNLRGDVLSLIGLRTFLGLTANGSSGPSVSPHSLSSQSHDHGSDHAFIQSDNQVMVVHSEKYASTITTGLVVDEIQDIRYLNTDQISTLSAPIEDQVAPYLQGVYEENGRLLVLLDLEKLLLSPAIWQFDLA